MPYREDDDAALARADALQVDLDRKEAELAATKARLADAARERDRLAAELRARGPRRPMPVPMPTMGVRGHGGRALAWSGLTVITLVGLVAMGRHAPRNNAREQSYYSEFQQCTIRTTPAGATIVAVDPGGRSTALGTTPLSRSILGGWGAGDDVLEARLAGYAPLRIAKPSPPHGWATCDVSYPLVPR